MKRLAIAVIVAGLAWSGWWFVAAQMQRRAVEGWFEARQAEGWEASYEDLSIRGFPNRLDTSFSGLHLLDPESGTAWDAPFFQILQLVYKRGHVILAFGDSQTVSYDGTRYEIASEGLRASVISDGGTVQRANLEAQVLNLSGDHALALAGVTGGIAALADDPETYRVALSAQSVATARGDLPPSPAGEDGLRLDAVLHLDAPLRSKAVSGPRPQPQRLELNELQYRLGELSLSLEGDVDVDGKGRMDGEITLRATNWRALIDMARDAGQIPEGMAETLEGGLMLIAGLSGNADRLDLPLDLDKGKARLGPIPLGEAPRLRLP